jgi:parallel beta-helix repeat protein
VRNNVITGNHARDNGGGMFIRYSAPIVLDNVISYNSSSADGGGVTIAEGSDGLVFSGNFVLANNAAEQGGGIHFVDSVSRMTPLTNNTIVSNSGTSGGGIFFHGSSSSLITNSILWYNSPDSIDAEALAGPVIANSDIEGGWSGTANIDLDPVFVDAVGGNYHLTATSPCIDSGDLNAPNLPTSDIDGDPRILGHGVDMGFDEARLFPYVAAVTPNRGRYDTSPSVSVLGSGFSFGTFPQVFFGQVPALNVVLVDGQTITCDVPAGEPGPICVTVSNDYGDGVLSNGFTYTPAVTIEGDTHVGSTITIHDLCDAGDGIFAVYGLPPQVSIPTPPFDGDLAIVPFHYLFYVPVWPFDSFDLPATIPSDPALVGVDVLLQSLIGPRLTTRPKDGRWTNCAVLSIL